MLEPLESIPPLPEILKTIAVWWAILKTNAFIDVRKEITIFVNRGTTQNLSPWLHGYLLQPLL